MSIQSSSRPRELRRRVNLRARMHANAKWSDAAILNISSRGLMINASSSSLAGSTVELWLGRQRIIGTVVWHNGIHAGVSADDFIPIDELLASDKGANLQLTAKPWPAVERRVGSRRHEESRHAGRLIEFCVVGLVALGLSIGALGFVGEAFARPLAKIQQVLG